MEIAFTFQEICRMPVLRTRKEASAVRDVAAVEDVAVGADVPTTLENATGEKKDVQVCRNRRNL